MIIETTYENVNRFWSVAQRWLYGDREKTADREKTKLGYAIMRLAPRVEKIQQKHQNLRDDIAIDCCSVDEKGIILRDDRNEFKYTPEKMKERNKKWQDLFETGVQIEPYYATLLPRDLNAFEQEAFIGFVMKDWPEEAEAATA